MVATGSITVAVRVRPPTSWEASRLPEISYESFIRGDGALSAPGRPITSSTGLRRIIQVIDDRVLCFDPAETDPAKAFVERGFLPPGSKRYKDKRFIFDRVLDHKSTQQEVYECTAKPLLQNVLNGFNATVFAYGATGCGKTHTISGTAEQPGVIYLTMADLFQLIEDRKDEHNFEVLVTFLEIYNEEIRDLLAESGTTTPRGGLQIREDTTVKVVGLTELRPTSADEVKQIVLLGNTRRTQSATNANETSSRSHAVLQVHVTQSPRTASLTEERTMATLSIIDLAGSERAAATTNMGQRMVEGANINKSLLALGNCINSLCEYGSGTRHIPYRNSKLTRLLKFSLGGNCKTVMIVCVAPTSQHFDDTHNTLIYAERATKIKTKVVTRNVLNIDRHVGQYVEAINRLNQEVAELKEKLAGKKRREEDMENRKRAEAACEVEKAKKDLQLKSEQTQQSIIDGAKSSAQLSVAQFKEGAIRARLMQIDAEASSSQGLSGDLEAERVMLYSLLKQEEEILKEDSSLSMMIHRSDNSASMFEAMLRAVTERRSDKLDEVSVENVKLDARCRKAEMDRAKAESQRDAVVHIASEQATTIVNLLGMVARYAAIASEMSRLLETSVEEGRDEIDATVKGVSAKLKNIANNNHEALRAVIGQSKMHVSDVPGSMDVFSRFAIKPVTRSSSIGIPPSSKIKDTKRSTSGGSTGSSAKRIHRSSPRKARTSIPQGRHSDKDKKKAVHWKDQAGKGDLAESELCSISVNISTDTSSSGSIPRSASRAGSESEWEDDKTEDSLSLSFTAAPQRDPVPQTIRSKRPRSSRLDPNFLRSKPSSTLASLAEDDRENDLKGTESFRRIPPLSDRDMNAAGSDSSSSSTISQLHVSKGRDRPNDAVKRMPQTPRAVGRSGRRRSNIGPMRSERARRRSSLIPQLSAQENNDNGGPKRVPLFNAESTIGKSPGRKLKRLSLLTTTRSMSALKMRPSGVSIGPLSFSDASASVGDLSFRGGRPTWK